MYDMGGYCMYDMGGCCMYDMGYVGVRYIGYKGGCWLWPIHKYAGGGSLWPTVRFHVGMDMQEDEADSSLTIGLSGYAVVTAEIVAWTSSTTDAADQTSDAACFLTVET